MVDILFLDSRYRIDLHDLGMLFYVQIYLLS